MRRRTFIAAAVGSLVVPAVPAKPLYMYTAEVMLGLPPRSGVIELTRVWVNGEAVFPPTSWAVGSAIGSTRGIRGPRLTDLHIIGAAK